ncbi:hypothetical protein NECAME_17589 [Necator americanus]|uniref:Uncharacterized protein n=1 Tax=Necator americanus TaxID=51031 RepID=W2TMJ6_NECAM|nr:hypothetical protein NECAME_17589 [Necator americanus]ETN82993.1 hypothetical protein NECAME_17589 [Necator americanus]
MTIEENEFMRELISHYNIDVDVENAAVTAKLSRNRWISEKFVDKWKRRFCRGNVACEISLYVDCSNVDSLDTKEIVEKCTGAKIIKPKPGVDLHLDMKGIMHDEAFDFFENLEEAHMCISVVETDYDSLNMSSLKKFIPCKSREFQYNSSFTSAFYSYF